MNLSLVITTYNRMVVLKKLLERLQMQTDSDFQVVVAVDGSTDGTQAMLNGLRLPYEMKWIDTECPGYGLALARNRGILAADGAAVAIIDDDSVPVPGFIAAHKASCASGTITGGPRNPANGDERMAWKMREMGRLPPLAPMTIEQLHRDWPRASLVENNICLLREDWIGVGLFSERLKLYGFIGQEFFARARFFGMKYQFNPAASVTHHAEHEGDNGLERSCKQRQTRWATLLRPSLMLPQHYRAQVAWAKAQAAGEQLVLPPFALNAALALPWRVTRMAVAESRRLLRNALDRG